MIVRRVSVLSVGKVLACLYALLGLIVGGLFSFLSLAGAAAGGGQGAAAIVFGVGAAIIMPILYGLAGFIGGVITAALYNLAASLVGGIEIELSPGWGQTAQQA